MNAHMAPTARRIMEQVLAVKPGERLVIVTDFERPRSITDLLTTTAVLISKNLRTSPEVPLRRCV